MPLDQRQPVGEHSLEPLPALHQLHGSPLAYCDRLCVGSHACVLVSEIALEPLLSHHHARNRRHQQPVGQIPQREPHQDDQRRVPADVRRREHRVIHDDQRRRDHLRDDPGERGCPVVDVLRDALVGVVDREEDGVIAGSSKVVAVEE